MPCLMPVGMTLRNRDSDLGRQRVGGDVEVRVRSAHQDVAHGAADEVALEAGRLEHSGKISNDPGNAHDAVQYSGTGGGMSRKALWGDRRTGKKKPPRRVRRGGSALYGFSYLKSWRTDWGRVLACASIAVED